MTPTAFFAKRAMSVAGTLMAIAIAITLVLMLRTRSLPVVDGVGETASAAGTRQPQEPAALGQLDWTLIERHSDGTTESQSRLAARFRLAGTFFQYTAMGSQQRKAIIDNKVADSQHIVSEQDRLDDVDIVKILRDHVVLRDSSGDEAKIWLSFSDADESTPVQGGERGPGDDDTLPFNGKRLGEHRWQFSRKSLLEYYRGLMDEPERLVLLFDSLKPVYTPEGHIEGYELSIEGEREFFNAVGMVEGDIVRSVNEVEMTNRRRAEFFIKSFVETEPSAFVLDIERGGQLEKFTYQFR